MDDEAPRITGENPPLRLWQRFPNWQNAYDEEGLPDQDETTLRPSDNQRTIDPEVTFTAGDARLSHGRQVPALICLAFGELDQVYIYPDPEADECWLVSVDPLSGRWKAMNHDWLLQAEGMLRVPLGDSSIFPLELTSRLPLEQTGKAIAVLIEDPA
jgi:hypothetical protein